jgi:hypothetical protein
MRNRTYIVASKEADQIKFLNGFPFQVYRLRLEEDLIKLISKSLANYDFSVPDDLKILTLDEFIKDFNEDEIERKINQKLHFIAHILVELL